MYMRFVLLANLAVCQVCQAWDSREHEYLGSQAFIRACRFAESDSTVSRDVYAAFCGRIETRSKLYGEATWISGDYVDDNGALVGDKLGALKLEGNTLHYAILATENDMHFHPSVMPEWLGKFSAALESAGKYGTTKNPAEKLIISNRVFYQNAYADHFLQDAFATGHFGFNRPLSSSSPSRLNHDAWSERGRFIRNSESTWYGFGDGCLDSGFKKCAHDSGLQDRNMRYIVEINSITLIACMQAMSGSAQESSDNIVRVKGLLPESFFVESFFDRDLILKTEKWPSQCDTGNGNWRPAEGLVAKKVPAYSLHVFVSGFADGDYFDAGLMPYLRVVNSLYLGIGMGWQFYSSKPDSLLKSHFIGGGSVMYLTGLKAYSSKLGFSINVSNLFRETDSGYQGVAFSAAHAFLSLEFGRVNPIVGVYVGRDLTGGDTRPEIGLKIGIAANWMHFDIKQGPDGPILTGH